MQLIQNDNAELVAPDEAAWKRYAFLRRIQAAARGGDLDPTDDDALEAECIRLHRIVMREIDG